MSLNHDVVIYQFIGKRACRNRFYPPFNDSELRRLVARAYPAEYTHKHKELSISLKNNVIYRYVIFENFYYLAMFTSLVLVLEYFQINGDLLTKLLIPIHFFNFNVFVHCFFVIFKNRNKVLNNNNQYLYA